MAGAIGTQPTLQQAEMEISSSFALTYTELFVNYINALLAIKKKYDQVEATQFAKALSDLQVDKNHRLRMFLTDGSSAASAGAAIVIVRNKSVKATSDATVPLKESTSLVIPVSAVNDSGLLIDREDDSNLDFLYKLLLYAQSWELSQPQLYFNSISLFVIKGEDYTEDTIRTAGHEQIRPIGMNVELWKQVWNSLPRRTIRLLEAYRAAVADRRAQEVFDTLAGSVPPGLEDFTQTNAAWDKLEKDDDRIMCGSDQDEIEVEGGANVMELVRLERAADLAAAMVSERCFERSMVIRI
ncbi:hypothetical protein LTR66_017739 [Elasticomyces elasticus]|nr:hypothetical protein LTR66_017739 [Elasticomyces elasticus]